MSWDDTEMALAPTGRTHPNRPEWLVDIFGADMFSSPVALVFDRPDSQDVGRRSVSVEEIHAMSNLRHLKQVKFQWRRLPPGAIKALSKLRELRNLVFWDCELEEEEVANLSSCPHLVSISFRASDLTDAGAKAIRDLPSLVDIDVSDTGVGDSGLQQILRIRPLRRLDISGTLVTDASIDAISRHGNLKVVEAECSNLTEDGVSRLRALRPELSINFVANGRNEVREPRDPLRALGDWRQH